MPLTEFNAAVESFIEKHGMTPTEFGKRFAGDPGFVFGLRDGREPRESTRAKIIEGMTAHVSKSELAE